MKTRKEALDVDYIGGQDDSLTHEEEIALHDFFAKKKQAATNANEKKRKSAAKRSKSLT
ncbi:hypothetical protein M3O96_10635 [Aquiflexum sp. TKW24L]|uniref:hypothetical protein n=1 Tax=Aquiflexum sp. TKW24L TaxID=2942212 RepID=UPI0020BF5D97|nr:hypothetical protein [Aquiflexum sp. TKW24L]MCL6259548.1 hypothetical protein [Aquiflexum sp. TKW24L]